MTPGKFKAPKKGDQQDKRCAFSAKHDDKNNVKHGRITWRQWCHGCEYYVCTDCEITTPMSVLGSKKQHDITAHQPPDSGGDDYDLPEGDDFALPN